MADKESSNVYQTEGFCNNIGTYCSDSWLFRQIKNVNIIDTKCMFKINQMYIDNMTQY